LLLGSGVGGSSIYVPTKQKRRASSWEQLDGGLPELRLSKPSPKANDI